MNVPIEFSRQDLFLIERALNRFEADVKDTSSAISNVHPVDVSLVTNKIRRLIDLTV